ncbi:hypothetical protein B0H19DRAFT_1077328 [Mycena capillaripes]|nr:hypothetical protein B0H19DRAFT_1077328 [Mycena capillaripes]
MWLSTWRNRETVRSDSRAAGEEFSLVHAAKAYPPALAAFSGSLLNDLAKYTDSFQDTTRRFPVRLASITQQELDDGDGAAAIFVPQSRCWVTKCTTIVFLSHASLFSLQRAPLSSKSNLCKSMVWAKRRWGSARAKRQQRRSSGKPERRCLGDTSRDRVFTGGDVMRYPKKEEVEPKSGSRAGFVFNIGGHLVHRLRKRYQSHGSGRGDACGAHDGSQANRTRPPATDDALLLYSLLLPPSLQARVSYTSPRCPTRPPPRVLPLCAPSFELVGPRFLRGGAERLGDHEHWGLLLLRTSW